MRRQSVDAILSARATVLTAAVSIMSEATQRDGSIERTTIPLTTEVRDELFNRKEPTDSYDDVLRRALDI